MSASFLSLQSLERETGIEPATNSLEGCDSTTELLPPFVNACLREVPRCARDFGCGLSLRSRPQNASTWKAVTLALAKAQPYRYSRPSLTLAFGRSLAARGISAAGSRFAHA